ncbi:prolyl 4-hydroxylase subunit alpha-2-like isoform X1 [Drosophila elegans]|uniref:prolyl 4-hydroxylase subunit alpha-2-like isoform X1 n=1 Tax=Drosophila elegans TaxID=30023 RepID=UPI0007E6A5B3|nr:prolyl 4-hydroxylase subunit alpha-2-like isoform X1 [Drosophila elegans]
MLNFKGIEIIAVLGVFLIFSNRIARAAAKNSYAASSEELMKLLKVEDKLVENLNGYVDTLKKKLNILEQSLKTMNSEHYKMKDDYEAYLGNPVNSFRLIHRLHTDWGKWHQYGSNIHELESIEKAHQMRKMLPTALDLKQACRGIDDLISFYDLKPDDLAAGFLAGYSDPGTALSAHDCFALGDFSMNDGKDDRAKAWLNASLKQLNEEKLPHKVNPLRKMSVLNTWAVLQMKNQELAHDHHHFGKLPKKADRNFLSIWIYEEMITKQKCRAHYRRSSRLHCRYNSTTTAFTRIAPLKMEELSSDPYMVIYHDVIYESEINWLLSTSEFTISQVGTAGTRSDIRSAKDSKISLSKGRVVGTLGQRVTDMTGLSMEMSDEFSLINYGLGGQYALHTDPHDHMNEIRWRDGDRIATVLFYLGDVESGGDTIFPLIDISVTPKKGSAVFWYNLHNIGDMNIRALHSGCPVIVGSKYVLTKWINELPQMFSTPCMKNAVYSDV